VRDRELTEGGAFFAGNGRWKGFWLWRMLCICAEGMRGSGGRLWKAWAGFAENGKYSRSRNVYFRITKHLIYEHKII
jgi:hypothetical protein